MKLKRFIFILLLAPVLASAMDYSDVLECQMKAIDQAQNALEASSEWQRVQQHEQPLRRELTEHYISNAIKAGSVGTLLGWTRPGLLQYEYQRILLNDCVRESSATLNEVFRGQF